MREYYRTRSLELLSQARWDLVCAGVLCALGAVALWAVMQWHTRWAARQDDVPVSVSQLYLVALALPGAWILVRGLAAALRALLRLRRGHALRSRGELVETHWSTYARAECQDHEDRLRGEPQWFPFNTAAEYPLACVYGGTADDWEALLTTRGASLIGSNHFVTVINLTQRALGDSLRALCVASGRTEERVSLPRQLNELHLLDRISAKELSGFLVDVLHTAEEELPEQAMAEDRAILEALVAQLDGELTISRLRAALRVLLHELPLAGSTLTSGEAERVGALYGADLRNHTSLLQRAYLLEQGLSFFAALGSEDGGDSSTEPPTAPHLLVADVGLDGDTVTAQKCAHLLGQVLLRSFRASSGTERGTSVLLLVGADRLPRRVLESMADLAASRSVQLLYLFEHLRGHTNDVLGLNRSCAAFFRLGQLKEAQAASEHIGRRFSYVQGETTSSSSTTSTRGVEESITESVGISDSVTRSSESGSIRSGSVLSVRSGSRSQTGGVATTRGSTVTIAKGVGRSSSEAETHGTATTLRRVHELLLEPDHLQSLHPSTLLVFEAEGGSRRFSVIDCDPAIVSLPDAKVSMTPPANDAPNLAWI